MVYQHSSQHTQRERSCCELNAHTSSFIGRKTAHLVYIKFYFRFSAVSSALDAFVWKIELDARFRNRHELFDGKSCIFELIYLTVDRLTDLHLLTSIDHTCTNLPAFYTPALTYLHPKHFNSLKRLTTSLMLTSVVGKSTRASIHLHQLTCFQNTSTSPCNSLDVDVRDRETQTRYFQRK